MIGTDEFVRNLSQGSRFRIIQRAEPSETVGTYHFLPPIENALGHVVGHFDYENPCFTMRKLEAKQEFYDDEPGLGRLVFLLHLSGSRRVELGSAHQHELTKPTLVVYYQPRGLDKRSVWSRGANELSMTVGVWPERLSSMFGFYPICFPSFSGAGGKVEPFWYSRPLPYAIMSAAEKLLDPGIHPLLLKNYIATKSKELLCLSLSTLLADGEFLSRPDLASNRVEHVRAMVDSNLKKPPSLSKLAITLGVPTQKLADEMRRETGVSHGQYITERRMKRAMMMLEAGNTRLKQVAYDVGYSHTSNFCAAFKRYFGSTPSDARGP